MLTPALPLPADLRRAAVSLVALALAAVVLIYAYADPGRYRDVISTGLPDIGIPSGVLVEGMMVLAALAMGWALGLVTLASPGGARAARSLWHAAVRAERTTRWTWAAALLLATIYAWMHLATGVQHQYASLQQYTDGVAATPFQFRALVPWTVAALRAVPSLGAVDLRVLYGVLDGLCAVGVWLAMRRFLRPYVGAPGEAGRAARAVAALAAFAPLALGTAAPWRHNAFYFPYDTLAVAVFALGLALLQERRWWAYYALFVVGTLNRETTCFLTIAWVLANWGRLPFRALAAHSAAQLVLWAGIKAGVAALYDGNPVLDGTGDGLFLSTWTLSTRLVLAVPAWIYLGLALGGAWVVLALLRNRLRHPELRRWFRFVPVFLLGMALVGELLEVRIYGELIPIVTAGLLLVLADVAQEAVGLAEVRAPKRSALSKTIAESAWVARGPALRSAEAPDRPLAVADSA